MPRPERRRPLTAPQVMIYQYALAREQRYRGLPIEGRLVYGDGAEVSLPAGSLDADFVNSLHDLLDECRGASRLSVYPAGGSARGVR